MRRGINNDQLWMSFARDRTLEKGEICVLRIAKKNDVSEYISF
jgi:hypothetical protein